MVLLVILIMNKSTMLQISFLHGLEKDRETFSLIFCLSLPYIFSKLYICISMVLLIM